MTTLHSSLILVTLLTFTFAASIWVARPGRVDTRWFAVFTFVVGCWSLGIAQVFEGRHPEAWARIAFAASCLMPATFLGFSRSFPTLGAWPSPRIVRIAMLFGFALTIISATTPLVITNVRLQGREVLREFGPLYPVFTGYFVSVWLASIVLLLRRWNDARGLERLQLQYLTAGVVFSLTGAIATNLALPIFTGRSTHSWIGPYFCLSFIAFVGHGMIRHRLMDLRLVIRRGLTLAVATLVSLVPVVALIAFAGPRLSIYLTKTEVVVGLLVIIATALLIPVTKDVAGRLLDRYVYRRQANYQRTVKEASAALTRVLQLRRLVDFMQKTISGAVDCEGVALYMFHKSQLHRRADEFRHESGEFGAPTIMPSAIYQQLDTTKDLIVAEELPHARTQQGIDALESELQALNWALVLPAISENMIIGAIVLGPKRSGDPYYPQDLDLLMTLANQAGIAIKNAQLYAQVVLANEYLENIVATMTSGVVAVDADGVVTMFNPAAEGMTGLTHDGAQGQSLTLLPGVLASAVADALREGVARTQLEVELSDGTTTRPVICASAPLRDPEGTLLGAVAVFSDLTPVRQLEIERRRAERLAYLETFAAGIAHEVKNPLVAIKTFAQLIPRRHMDERFVDEFSRIVGREIIRMERLIDRLRTLSRPGLRPHRIVDVRQPVVDALEFMQATFEEKGVVVEATLGDEEAPVLGDGNELEQLFLNLLMNANEATSTGARIGVSITREDGRILVSISDSGPGIPEDELKRVFDPFYTTKERGSGLGLYVCVGIAETHGARLHVENVPTGGARFNVEFPLASEVSAAVAS